MEMSCVEIEMWHTPTDLAQQAQGEGVQASDARSILLGVAQVPLQCLLMGQGNTRRHSG